MTQQRFSKKVLAWYDQYGRKDLPWQKNITAYRVWVSEIMLQQTQVTTVIPYYKKFMKTFTSLKKLANANDDQVLQHWTGLGYYSRARNLHKTAKVINAEYNGRFPQNRKALEALPGIGRSTAAAICALAFQQSEAILDGNVKRVLSRYTGLQQWPGSPQSIKHLFNLAESLLPSQRIADYTQAMMDLGALICTRSKPSCSQCPISKTCYTYKNNLQDHLPIKKPKKTLPVKKTILLIMVNNKGQVFLEKRPPAGIWGGLWSFPEIEKITLLEKYCQNNQIEIINKNKWDDFRHTFSHYHLDITPYYLEIKKINTNKVQQTNQTTWCDVTQPLSFGVAAPVIKLLKQLEQSYESIN